MVRRNGFTLIELLIVVVIIGILAAIAIPKFSAVRERAYFSAMKADLRNLQAQQQIYYSSSAGMPPAPRFAYATDVNDADLGFVPSNGVTIEITQGVPLTGWSAVATHAAFGDDPARSCAVFVGDAASIGPATVQDVVMCQGET